MQTEIILMWLAVSLYALSAVLFVVSLVFKRTGLTRIALAVALLGLLPHTVAIGMRWVRVDHGPYLGFYEVVSSFAWISVLALGTLAWRRPALNVLGVILMPIAFLLLGGAMFAPQAELAITGTLASWWLTIHVAFAKLSYGAFIASFALALVYLYRERAGGMLADALSKLPDQEVLDDLQFRFVSVGFVFLGIMIVAGAIWANEAWGRYWAWDPIETWSLISWVVYAAYLHARLTLAWRGRRSALFALLALPVVVFALIGVPLVYKSIHGAYLIGY
ncbi:MAG: c-type cytochrome biogenesis protein CcsB [Actinobacteria bacterium HGW-Actinobacteria-10]|jgi:cytochrome c-type biogenesis protein CcsB|nr:MAG: c-type cytochrome biogenesis protein CcsB [Actinobacteria bacterium HGW-Actinobacteria-10]